MGITGRPRTHNLTLARSVTSMAVIAEKWSASLPAGSVDLREPEGRKETVDALSSI